jgi:hypothetical protein
MVLHSGEGRLIFILRVFKLQKKSLRIIFKKPPDFSCKQLFKDHKILTFYAIYVFQTVLLVKNYSKYTSLNSDFHTYNTRFKNNYHMPHRRLNFTNNSPFVRGVKFFNVLPESIKSLSGGRFKNELKSWLIDLTPYSLEEVK